MATEPAMIMAPNTIARLIGLSLKARAAIRSGKKAHNRKKPKYAASKMLL